MLSHGALLEEVAVNVVCAGALTVSVCEIGAVPFTSAWKTNEDWLRVNVPVVPLAVPITITGIGTWPFAKLVFTITVPAYTAPVNPELGVIVKVAPERFTLAKLGTDTSANPVNADRSLAVRFTVCEDGVTTPF